MDITLGMFFLGTGIAGCIACITIFCIMEKNWNKQRKILLHEIEMEE